MTTPEREPIICSFEPEFAIWCTGSAPTENNALFSISVSGEIRIRGQLVATDKEVANALRDAFSVHRPARLS